MQKITGSHTIFAAAAIAGLFAITRNITAASADAQQVQGFYIFTDSKPISEYTYLGTVTPKTVQVGDQVSGNEGLAVCELTYTQLRDDLIKQAKKKYKDGTAIIIYPAESKGEVIKIK
jgi:hypothetical protein